MIKAYNNFNTFTTKAAKVNKAGTIVSFLDWVKKRKVFYNALIIEVQGMKSVKVQEFK